MHRVSRAPDDAGVERDEPPGARSGRALGARRRRARPASPARGRCASGTGGSERRSTLDGDGPFVVDAAAVTSPTTAGTGTTPTWGTRSARSPRCSPSSTCCTSASSSCSGSPPRTPSRLASSTSSSGFPLAAVAMFALARSQGLSRWGALAGRRAVRQRPGPPGALPPPVAGRLLGRPAGHVGGARGAAWTRVLRAHATGARHPIVVPAARRARRGGDGGGRSQRGLLRGVHPAPARGGHGRPALGDGEPARCPAGRGPGPGDDAWCSWCPCSLARWGSPGRGA